MNKDAREDHTLRNALLLTGGLAAGGVGGIKLAEKAALKSGKAFRGSDVNKFVKNTADDIASKVKNAASNLSKDSKAGIKTKPNTSTVKAAANAADKIKELEDFLKTLEIELEQYKRANNTAKMQETQKLIGQVKERLAKLKGF